MVDAEVKGAKTSSVFALDVDGTWIHYVTRTPPRDHQLGTQPDDAAALDRNARDYVAALKARDCAAIYRLTNPDSRQLGGGKVDEGQLCKNLRGAYQLQISLPARIRKARGVQPQPLGRTRDNGFYAIELPDGGYWTLILSTVDKRVAERRREGHEEPSVLDFLRANRDRR
ncbi:MAG: hypothetical protein M3375_01500 [Actinomycetota bacterium]|nr:hypothetical protein [Actinomycetota bacterium]